MDDKDTVMHPKSAELPTCPLQSCSAMLGEVDGQPNFLAPGNGTTEHACFAAYQDLGDLKEPMG